MICLRRWVAVSALFASMLVSSVAIADKISTQDFYELPKSAKMSQVTAAVGQPNEKRNPAGQPMIEWYYDNVPWHVNGKPCEVIVYFDKNTERLVFLKGPDGMVNKR